MASTVASSPMTANVVQMPGKIQPTKLFIGGISRNTTTKHLRDHFSKYGRVLDCVAMRTADGQPRGFGYVTLDSLAAAHKCLAMPQNLDNRIVDMKLAVPEGSGSSPKGSFNMNMFASASLLDAKTYGHGYDQWPDASMMYGNPAAWWAKQSMLHDGHQDVDCMDLLCPPLYHTSCASTFGEYSDAAARDATRATGLLLPPVLASEPKPCNVTGQMQQMSASAPEFVPKAKQQTENSKPKNSKQTERNRAPLGELTNLGQADEILKPFESPTKAANVAVGTLSPPSAVEKPACPPKRPGLFLRDQALDDFEIHVDEPVEKEDIDSESTASDETDEDIAEEVAPDQLPSVGSADHFSGECKRCNFFAKGRCQHGKDCSFCHFPHEKRKLSRQEKRERRATWQFDNVCAAALEGDAFARMRCSSEPAPPPGLSLWLEEDDLLLSAQPNAAFIHSGFPGCGGQYATQHVASSSVLSAAPLSTAPTPACTPFNTPTVTPSANSAPLTMFPGSSILCTQPANCSDVKPEETVKAQQEAESSIEASLKEAKHSSSSYGHLGYQWARDELLQFRDVLKEMPEFKDLPCKYQIRTQAIVSTAA